MSLTVPYPLSKESPLPACFSGRPRLLGLRSPWGSQAAEGAVPHGGIARPGCKPGERNQGHGAREAGGSLVAHGPALRDGKGPRQAERAREAGDRNLAAFSVARFAGSGVSTFGAALGRWHRGAVPRIIAGGEGRGFSGPNPRIKAKEKCAATAAREGVASAILRGPAGARSMVLLVPGVAGRKNGGPHPRLGFSAALRGAKCRNSRARSAGLAPPRTARWPRVFGRRSPVSGC